MGESRCPEAECFAKNVVIQFDMGNINSNKEKLLGFITRDGKKHLGYYTPLVNPCGDYNDPKDYQKRYTDVHGTEFADVIAECDICEVECYCWDEQENGYKPLPAYEPPKRRSYDMQAFERAKGLFRKDLITSSPRPALDRMIHEWLSLNAHCTAPVYIDQYGRVRSEGAIEIDKEAAQSIPGFIKIVKE